MKWVTALLGMVCISLTAHALTSEGFTLEPPRSNLQSAWDHTFAISDMHPSNPLISASVLIFKRRVGAELYLGFLTSGHSLRRTENRVEGKWNQLLISRNIRIQNEFLRDETLSGSILSPVMDMERDLGFFIIRIPGAKAAEFDVVPFSPNCKVGFGDPLALIGFPGVPYRKLKDRKVQILDSDVITKRGSAGVFVGQKKYGKDQIGDRYPILGTTADAMDGNSGGPAVDIQGHLIGILVGSEANERNGYTYMGSDDPRDLKAHSFITDCQVTKDFAFDIWRKFFQENWK
jgi:hypothetical protein